MMKDIPKHFTREELMEMSEEDLGKLVGFALANGAKVTGTGIVRSKEGKVKYDNPELKGSYGER